MLGINFHQEHLFQLLDNTLTWMHLFKPSMFMFVVDTSFLLKHLVTILFSVVRMHFNYSLHFHQIVAHMEISTGMMVIQLVCFSILLYQMSLSKIIDPIGTKTYNYFQFNMTSAVSFTLFQFIFICIIDRIHWQSML